MQDASARRLMRMPDIGPITASTIVEAIGNTNQLRTRRNFAARLGLTPAINPQEGKTSSVGLPKRVTHTFEFWSSLE